MSTVRAFSNTNKRLATGRTMSDGTFLQFYPTKTSFANERAWREEWVNNNQVVFKNEEEVAAMKTVKTKPTPAAASTPSKPKPSCCVCHQRMGVDHRMCLVSMLHSGVTNVVDEWHRQSGFEVPGTSAPAPTPITPPRTTSSVPAAPPPVERKKKYTEPNKEDWSYKGEHKFTAPPGTYYIGDICYFLQEPIYDRIFGGQGYESGLYTRKTDNAFFMVDGTAYGDGEYEGSDGFGYGVDAGIIGIASRVLGPEEDANVYGGKLHTFKDPVEIKFANGIFRFKSHSKYLIIDTQGNTYNSDEDW